MDVSIILDDMATTSPTPFQINRDQFPRRALSRNYERTQFSRPHLKRGSPLSSKPSFSEGPFPQPWKFSIGDSSDDEAPVPPMKFSAEAKAILGDDASVVEGSSPSQKHVGGSDVGVQSDQRPWARRSPPVSKSIPRDRTDPPGAAKVSSPRVVRLSPGTIGSTTLRRTASILNNGPRQLQNSADLITPAPRSRNPSSYRSKPSSERTSLESLGLSPANDASTKPPAEPMTIAREQINEVHDSIQQMESLSINKYKGEDMSAQGSLRVKRAGKVTGRYLSGPARRGMKRRQSEEDQSPAQGNIASSGGTPPRSKNDDDLIDIKMEPLVSKTEHLSEGVTEPSAISGDYQNQHNAHVGPIIGNHEPIVEKNNKMTALHALQTKTVTGPASAIDRSPKKPVHPLFKVPPLPLLPSRFDQENEPPPTFKRNKPNGLALSERQQKFAIVSDEKMLIETPVTISPPRQVLAPRSQNTPYRPAPPPPKMTVLETATATGGAASVSQSRKKRNYISVNQKIFTRMDCIGRGGSSKVYRVMAENYKVFALKRVSLEDQDELAIRGFKGEIDLLQKLQNIDRVVRLFDWEINEAKQTLSVLMEMGESDLNRVLTVRLNSEEATFDITFTRYFWREMLDCVDAVHAHDIVHSDLKPANFLLLQGRLKLIDFGISNAIQDDTVNVHREQHIGTPNYMSPEALIDSNAANGLPSCDGKIMKLGKPSDVWSLGCILYQMVYGKPPFAHIANQMQRIVAIPNPRHVIDFPSFGIGGVLLPPGLIRTLRRCLSRDQTLRPIVQELLAPGDPFLDPDAYLRGTIPMGEEFIRQIQNSILGHVKAKGIPTDEEVEHWPAKMFGSIKASVEAGRGP